MAKTKTKWLTTDTFKSRFSDIQKAFAFEGAMPKYKMELVVPPDADLIKEIDAAVDNAWDTLLTKLKPKARKSAKKFYPYEEEFDKDTEEETGNMLVTFRANESFKDKDTGEKIMINLKIKDSEGNMLEREDYPRVRIGADVQCVYTIFPFANPSTGDVGVSLRLQGLNLMDATGSKGNGGGQRKASNNIGMLRNHASRCQSVFDPSLAPKEAAECAYFFYCATTLIKDEYAGMLGMDDYDVGMTAGNVIEKAAGACNKLEDVMDFAREHMSEFYERLIQLMKEDEGHELLVAFDPEAIEEDYDENEGPEDEGPDDQDIPF